LLIEHVALGPALGKQLFESSPDRQDQIAPHEDEIDLGAFSGLGDASAAHNSNSGTVNSQLFNELEEDAVLPGGRSGQVCEAANRVLDALDPVMR
jgi:hypothetical protein